MLLSGMMLVSGSFVFVSCDPEDPQEPMNTLSVLPSDDIAFNGEDNANVVLTITTDADSWDAKPTESWITLSKSGDKLTVNATDNGTGAERSGWVKISAGTAKVITISVTQAKVGPVVGGKVDGSLQDGDNVKTKTFQMVDENVEAVMYFSINAKSESDVDVDIIYDEAYLSEYNFLNGTACQLFPESLLTLSNDGNAVVPQGKKVAPDTNVTMAFDESLIEYNVSYLVPLTVKANSTNVNVKDADCRVNYIVKRRNKKEVRNMLYFEVNDTNPLNALEYVIEDGQMFFDEVILFAANINYNSAEDRVYLHNNTNVQNLLDETDKFLQPLREKGIKVNLGLLGNHDAAGLCQLSDWGAQQWAADIADAIEVYKLDGVNLDDEYSKSPIIGNKWFTSTSTAAGARLAYELKKAMKETCTWDTTVSLFYWGYFNSGLPAVDGNSPSTFIDYAFANYGGAASPVAGADKKMCSGMSVELNLGGGQTSETFARSVKNNGYGWYMWFALDWKQTNTTSKLQSVCRGLYDKELPAPIGYYKWVKDGGNEANKNNNQRYSKATNEPIDR